MRWGAGALIALASVPNFFLPFWVGQMLREPREGTRRTQKVTLAERILAPPKKGAR